MSRFTPKSVICLREYTWQKFFGDLIAGLTVGMVALPLAMAFAISSGVSPQAGIYTAIVAGFLISALGGSKTQIGGPTGAFVVIVYGIVAKYGIDGLSVCTLMAGVNSVGVRRDRFGKHDQIHSPTGYCRDSRTASRFSSLAHKSKTSSACTSTKCPAICRPIGSYWRLTLLRFLGHPTALASAAIVVIVLFRRFVTRIPAYIVALVHWNGNRWNQPVCSVETIGTCFGGIPTGLPSFIMPHLDFNMIGALFPSALTVALLGAIESLLSAVVSDRMSGDKHNPNVELWAKRIANLVSPLFGGIPATGAIARTATNVRSGAKSPMAGMIHAATLLCVLLFAAPLAKFIPLSVLAAILLVVAYNMGEWHEIPKLLKLTWADISVWAITFGLTVFADLDSGSRDGNRAGRTFVYPQGYWHDHRHASNATVRRGRLVTYSCRISRFQNMWPCFAFMVLFYSVRNEKISLVAECLDTICHRSCILRLRNMTAIDATGLQALEDLADAMPNQQTHADFVRCTTATHQTNAAGRIRTACWQSEYL